MSSHKSLTPRSNLESFIFCCCNPSPSPNDSTPHLHRVEPLDVIVADIFFRCLALFAQNELELWHYLIHVHERIILNRHKCQGHFCFSACCLLVKHKSHAISATAISPGWIFSISTAGTFPEDQELSKNSGNQHFYCWIKFSSSMISSGHRSWVVLSDGQGTDLWRWSLLGWMSQISQTEHSQQQQLMYIIIYKRVTIFGHEVDVSWNVY